ncbi:hypothetical protein L1049_003939 [Liquidambar formosana]|uniref:F-box protein n=1 Tax=Liquidambar formosana TaxID=63359 RepID=A0AAP0WVL7_LIQFO
MADGCQVLSQDCWELIFNLVDDDNLEAISLVCKEFFTISNRIRCSLNVYNHPSIRELRQLLQRFRGLKTIDLSKFSGNLDGAVHEIAQSGLNLEALNLSYQKTLPLKSSTELGSASMKRSLKTLKCRNVCVLRNSEIAAIVNLCHGWKNWISGIQDITGMMIQIPCTTGIIRIRIVLNAPDCDIDDKGMAMIAERCRGLLRLNLTNCGKVTGKGVKEVAEKCRKLKDINLRECCNVSADFLAWMVWSRPSLRSFCDFVPKEDQIMYRASPDFLMARKTVLPEDWLS